MNRRVAVRGIIAHQGKLLCFQLKAYDGKPAAEFWSTPGGGVQVGEALIPALEREMLEETGIKPVVGQLLYVQQFVWHDLEQMEFFFLINNAADYLTIDPSKTSHGAVEVEKFEFVDAATEKVLPEFLQRESFENLAEAVAPKFFNYL